jgi:hypothetical protein
VERELRMEYMRVCYQKRRSRNRGGGGDSLTDAERAARCLGAGMWGGALPQDWDNNDDAEAYRHLALSALSSRSLGRS